jgi:cystathionine beta-lyase/cystathionine gamma-synthase
MSAKSKASICVHAGEDKMEFANAVVPPVFNTSTYVFKNMEELHKYVKGDPNYYLYSRYTNPTVEAGEVKLAALEGGEKCLIVSSGQAAAATAVLALLHPGDHMVTSPTLYGGIYGLFTQVIRGTGLNLDFAESTSTEDFKKAIRPNTKIIYTETPTNPNLAVLDLAALANLAKENNAIMMVDNTFATPINQTPLELDADIIIHSGTKYLGGHSDLVCGAIVGPHKYMKQIYEYRKNMGTNLDPHAASMLLRGMKTLAVRVERQNQNAMKIARYLESHAKVKRVRFPGLESFPQHELAKKQMRGFGGMICFEIGGGLDTVGKVVESMHMFIHATSLGGVESLVSIPVLTSHIAYSPEDLIKADVNDGMIRLSCGIEDADDLIADLDHALTKA